MASTFGGLNTALTSLYAQRRGLDVTGQNIANSSTEGYTRQRVRLAANAGGLNPGVYSTVDQVGNGVQVASVERGRSQYLEERGRTEHGNSAYLANQTATYNAIEDVFAEPSDTALQARMHDMWDAWNDVANNWQDPSTRTALVERATTVATSLRDAHASLSNQFTANTNETAAYVDQINELAVNVAKMNNQIVVSKQANLQPNELMDQRDRAIMQLAELAGATTIEQPSGAVNVYLGNGPIVSEFSARAIRSAGPPTLDGVSEATPVSLQWTDTGGTVSAGGTIGSMVDTMNTVIPRVSGQLDKVAQDLADTVNGQHRTGFSSDGTTGLDFFVGEIDGTDVTAKTIRVAVTEPAKVAYSSANPVSADPTVAGTSNHDIADRLSDIGASGTGPDQTYQQMIGQLGVAAQASGRRSEIQNSVRDQVDTDRTAESGVNLDEEMTNLLTFQRGYEAASRVLTTVDSMLDQLINRTGLVGR
jgi:flagellar hook-associated protein 1 FlgK